MKYEDIELLIDYLFNIDYVKTCYISGSITRDENTKFPIQLNLLVFEEDKAIELIKSSLSKFEQETNTLIHIFNYDTKFIILDHEANIVSINIVSDFEIKNEGKIEVLFDKTDLLVDNLENNDTLNIKEFSQLINKLCIESTYLYNYTNANDSFLSFKTSLNILDLFVKIYRGYYDSYNAKMGYQRIDTLMDKKYITELIDIMKFFKINSFMDGVLVVYNKLDEIIKQLPINIVSLINIDVYQLSKKLMYKL